jgi:choline dehydrogenase-like flavoprotein
MMDCPTALTTMGEMTDDQHYDVAIIGTGAGGGTLGHRLAAAGRRVLWLERGPFLPRELDNWDSEAVFVRGKYLAPEHWYDGRGHEFQPEVNYYVGGNTKFYGAALFRLRPEDFGEITHHGGISPAWPIDYADLEPYYTEAEHLYQVHGRHGEDPTEGAASAPYAYGPVTHEPRIQRLSDDLEKLGLHPFHLPIGVRLDEDERGQATRHSACIRCSKVDGFPCLLGAKSDSATVCVEPSLRLENVTLVTEANVQRLETDPSGRTVTKIVTEMADGEIVSFSADMVVVACGAVNSAALLLRSAATTHPDGLANRSGVVGRYYMRHNNVAVMAVSEEPNPTVFQKTLAMNDWYLGADDWDFPLGGIQMLGKSDDVMIHAEAPRWAGKLSPDVPFEVLAHHAVDFWLCGEDLPRGDSRVTLDKDGAIHLDIDEKNNVEGVKRLRHKLDGMLGSLGLHRRHLLDHSLYLHKSMPIGATAHQAGTVRFGTDPLESALDPNCRAHDVDNLYVVDTSFFPSIGAVNPSLTAMANALRVGDHLLERLG